jgi:catechol 2,3-dioxygenase-like lactoylglutathione lyase family enzyme
MCRAKSGSAFAETMTTSREELQRRASASGAEQSPAPLHWWKTLGVDQRLSLVTLGVADLDRARHFYEALGWTSGWKEGEDVVFFPAGGVILALWGREQLAEDSGVEDGGGWGGVTLAHNVRLPEEVDAVMEEAERAGAVITRPAGKTFWGGYSGAFTDPDGHPWEIAHNPHWTLDDDGSVRLP